jgi:hypothetical protein
MSASTVCVVGSRMSSSPLVRPHLELLARHLVDVRAAQTVYFEICVGRGDRSRHLAPVRLAGVDDFRRRLVEHAVVVSLESDADLFRSS